MLKDVDIVLEVEMLGVSEFDSETLVEGEIDFDKELLSLFENVFDIDAVEVVDFVEEIESDLLSLDVSVADSLEVSELV